MNGNKYKILVVEDDAHIRNLLVTVLESADYHVITAETCALAVTLTASYTPDLILLDLGLPDADGMVFLSALRRSSPTPVIVLSARANETDKVNALDTGANDYVTKPFGTAELLARVRSALRNSRVGDAAKLPGGCFELHDLRIDYDARRVTLADAEVKLTQTEYNILSFLSEHSGKVMTYSAIIKAIWGQPDDGAVKKLQVNMANIRRKLCEKPGEAHYIVNELGVGYRLCGERG
mgnify:FL=1